MAKFGVSQYDHSQFEQKWNVGDKCYAGYCKCFTYVTKTFANLTTYSRKPENYNGTIIFEIDILKNSSPINLNLCQTWLFQKIFGCFFCFDLLWNWAESAVNPAEKNWYFGFHCGKKCEFWIQWGWVFHDVISKIMVPL